MNSLPTLVDHDTAALDLDDLLGIERFDHWAASAAPEAVVLFTYCPQIAFSADS